MEKTESLLQTSLERIRLQQEVYDLYRLHCRPNGINQNSYLIYNGYYDK